MPEEYYSSAEFHRLLDSYEQMLHSGEKRYFDVTDMMEIIDFYIYEYEFDKSLQAAEYGLKLHPGNHTILLAKANSLLLLGNPDDAKEIADTINDDTNQEALFIKGSIELARENIDKSEEYFNRAYDISHKDTGMIYDIIQQHFTYCAFSQEQQWLDRAFLEAKNQSDVQLYELQIELHEETNNYNLAIEWIKRLLNITPFNHLLWLQLGQLYFEEKRDYIQAKECFEYSASINYSYDTLILIADCLYHMADYTGAMEQYQKIATEFPHTLSMIDFKCGRCLYAMAEREAALTYLLRSEDAIIKSDNNQNDEESIEPYYIELYTLLGKIYIELHNGDEALKHIYSGLNIAPYNEELNQMVHIAITQTL